MFVRCRNWLITTNQKLYASYDNQHAVQIKLIKGLTLEERRIQALEMRCYRRLLNISYKDHVTNEEVRNRIQKAIGMHDDLITMVVIVVINSYSCFLLDNIVSMQNQL